MPEKLPYRLAVVSHVPHYRQRGKLFAYTPYSREIEIWADLFREVVLLAPCRDREPAADCSALNRENISILAQVEFGGPSLTDKIKSLAQMPSALFSLAAGMRSADAIHVRCPGNLGLLGTLLAPLVSRNRIAKYAGQWTPFPGESPTTKLQRFLLRSKWWNAPVTVYGSWPDQPSHVIPFFTSVLTAAQLKQATMPKPKRADSRFTVLFVGRLSKAKNVDVLLEAVSRVRKQGVSIRCLVVGEGAERRALETLSQNLDLTANVEFFGGVSFERIPDLLHGSDCFVLASETEGWPKALVEAMAHGLVCIGSDRGLIPQILSEGRGFVVPPGDIDALARVLSRVAAGGAQFESIVRAASDWARKYSIEELRDGLREVMLRHWGPVPCLTARELREKNSFS